jgi:hypothetical protein
VSLRKSIRQPVDEGGVFRARVEYDLRVEAERRNDAIQVAKLQSLADVRFTDNAPDRLLDLLLD